MSWMGGLQLPRELQKPRTAIGSLKPDPRHGLGSTGSTERHRSTYHCCDNDNIVVIAILWSLQWQQ